ncbi:MAG: oxidative damage protection protein [Buchnera aphidicola (Kaburagia rhusicola ensigallis)]
MNRNIFCHFLKKFDIGLDAQPYPGKLGKKIYKKISKLAWKQWTSQQTKIINEKKLSMINKEHRQMLEHSMIDFLFNNTNICDKNKKNHE